MTSTSTPASFPYLYVYPFRDLAQVHAWQRSYEAGGHQPWHLDPGITASSLAGFLGYATAGQVMSAREDASGAHVGLGFRNPNGVRVIATTVHLVRVGTGNDAPWEVVGDEPSSTLAVTTPTYGATVLSPMRVGGLITGVDESLHVQVHQLSTAPPIGDRCCIAAGGDRQPWSIEVVFASTDPVVVISVATGGHLQAIESFAFTAARAAGATARATP
jgi:hypothetical protein